MLRSYETSAISHHYFKVLKETPTYIELLSRKTGHCWIIQRLHFVPAGEAPLLIYHKHSIKDTYYHKHAKSITVWKAVKKIKCHDQYVFDKSHVKG